jgi:hypothetical protein
MRNVMVFTSVYKCWEIMNCDNLDCPARHEPETPCWEIARKVEAYHNASNTCNDCVVYILKEETSDVNIKKLQNSIKQKGYVKNISAGHHVCI